MTYEKFSNDARSGYVYFKGELHLTDPGYPPSQPASVTLPNGSRFWFNGPHLHRDDGPAQITGDGAWWFWRGVRVFGLTPPHPDAGSNLARYLALPWVGKRFLQSKYLAEQSYVIGSVWQPSTRPGGPEGFRWSFWLSAAELLEP